MLLKTTGLVIFEKKQSEQDRLLTILTPENGMILARVNSPGRMTGKLAAGTEFLTYSEFTLFLRKEVAVVDAAEPKRLFYGMRTDPEKLALAAYFARLTYDLFSSAAKEDCAGALRLFLNTLAFLEEDKMPKALLKAVFEMRCMAMSGYRPDLSACRICKKSAGDMVFFLPQRGQLICSECENHSAEEKIPLNGDLLCAMKSAMSSDLKEAFSFRLGEKNLLRFAFLAESYCIARLEYLPATLRYYKSICESLEAYMPPTFSGENPEKGSL
ncbi:MAG: DNA repair protein RecO [Oscillospiraceae bacterium]|nr:DNA repair protein RecO [Oscillospiraceae bacterium]